MADQRRQLKAAVDEVFAYFDDASHTRDQRIAVLENELEERDSLKRENDVLKQQLKQTAKQVTAQRSTPSETATFDYSRELFNDWEPQIEVHASCCERLRFLQGKYNKLLEEAQVQAANAKDLEDALKKARKKLHEWRNWHLSSDLGKADLPDALKTPGQTETTDKLPNASRSKDQRGLSPNAVQKPEDDSNNLFKGTRESERVGRSSPALPTNPRSTSRAGEEPRGLHGAVYERRHSLTDIPCPPTSTEPISTMALSTSRNTDDQNALGETKYQATSFGPSTASNDPVRVDRGADPLSAIMRGNSADTAIKIDSDDSPTLTNKPPDKLQITALADMVDLSMDLDRSTATHSQTFMSGHTIHQQAFPEKAPGINVTSEVSRDTMASSSFHDLANTSTEYARSKGSRQASGRTRDLPRKKDAFSSPVPRKRKISDKDPVEADPIISEVRKYVDTISGNPKRSKLYQKAEDRITYNAEVISRLDDLMSGRSRDKAVLKPRPLSHDRAAAGSGRISDIGAHHQVQPSLRKVEPLTPIANPPNAPPAASTISKRPASSTKKLSTKFAHSSFKHRQRPPNRRSQTPPNRAVSPSSCPSPSSPSAEPLRSRPLNKLNLSDFRINPASNSGYDYAYTDVVRPRAQRKCLPGCTDPDCCGAQFRPLAAELPSTALLPPTSLFSSSPTDEGEDADAKLIAGYLGDESAPRHLSQGERERVLTEAKVRVLADRYGKMHRQKHEKRKSPPGFWEVEMVGTQEVERHRQEGRRRAREMIEERWRDARKGGGLWVFADE